MVRAVIDQGRSKAAAREFHVSAKTVDKWVKHFASSLPRDNWRQECIHGDNEKR
jgi:hypothetical protein